MDDFDVLSFCLIWFVFFLVERDFLLLLHLFDSGWLTSVLFLQASCKFRLQAVKGVLKLVFIKKMFNSEIYQRTTSCDIDIQAFTPDRKLNFDGNAYWGPSDFWIKKTNE